MKLCLIGSSRFLDLYLRANKELTLEGHIVYSIATVSSSAGEELPEEQKTVLDLVHLRKITESEAVVLITDSSGYYGTSTKRELLWARVLERRIFVFVPFDPVRKAHIGFFYGNKQLSIPSADYIQEAFRECAANPDHEARSDLPVFATRGGEA